VQLALARQDGKEQDLFLGIRQGHWNHAAAFGLVGSPGGGEKGAFTLLNRLFNEDLSMLILGFKRVPSKGLPVFSPPSRGVHNLHILLVRSIGN
jgi:hypothetical protein